MKLAGSVSYSEIPRLFLVGNVCLWLSAFHLNLSRDRNQSLATQLVRFGKFRNILDLA